jgi:hypothetical protein
LQVETRSDRGVMLLIHGLWFHTDVWTPWLGVGGAVAERLLNDGDAAAAISLAPVPGGYPAVPTAAHLLRHASRLALLSLHGSAVAPPFPQFWRTIASVSSGADARDFYEKYVVADKPRPVLLHAVRHRTRAKSRQVQRGPLLLGLGTQGAAVLFYCLDWLTAQNM